MSLSSIKIKETNIESKTSKDQILTNIPSIKTNLKLNSSLDPEPETPKESNSKDVIKKSSPKKASKFVKFKLSDERNLNDLYEYDEDYEYVDDKSYYEYVNSDVSNKCQHDLINISNSNNNKSSNNNYLISNCVEKKKNYQTREIETLTGNYLSLKKK